MPSRALAISALRSPQLTISPATTLGGTTGRNLDPINVHRHRATEQRFNQWFTVFDERLRAAHRDTACSIAPVTWTASCDREFLQLFRGQQLVGVILAGRIRLGRPSGSSEEEALFRGGSQNGRRREGAAVRPGGRKDCLRSMQWREIARADGRHGMFPNQNCQKRFSSGLPKPSVRMWHQHTTRNGAHQLFK